MNACIAKMRTSPNHRQRRTQSVPAIGTPSGTEEEYGDFWNTASTPIMAGYSILKYLEEHQNRIDRLDLNKQRMRDALRAALALVPAPTGFTVGDFPDKIHAITGTSDAEYTILQAAYDLRKLRG
jgi:hypothetical protein